MIFSLPVYSGVFGYVSAGEAKGIFIKKGSLPLKVQVQRQDPFFSKNPLRLAVFRIYRSDAKGRVSIFLLT